MSESESIRRKQAIVYFEQGHKHQMRGEFADAILLYKRSIAIFPTAEAYTFLGWTYSLMNRYEEAIEACEQAIETDPTLGNPYNDIGAYLIEMERHEEAIPWLQKAMQAERYEAPQYPHLNLGRVYQHLGDYEQALACYDRALEIDPHYRSAHAAKYHLLGKLN